VVAVRSGRGQERLNQRASVAEPLKATEQVYMQVCGIVCELRPKHPFWEVVERDHRLLCRGWRLWRDGIAISESRDPFVAVAAHKRPSVSSADDVTDGLDAVV
jgi:hypothetical protein